ncbi:MAG: transporter ATP-binding protein [Chloroflexi bacterium]|nr:transporter ATP-binding protein [Chloroflexota bacterium]
MGARVQDVAQASSDRRLEAGSGLPPVTQSNNEVLIPVHSRGRALAESWLPPILALIVLVVVWIAAIRWKNTPPIIAPSPGDVVNGFRNNTSDILTALWSTFKDAFIGLGLSILIGVSVAVIMSQSKLLERAIFPYTTLAQTIPIFAIAPLIDNAAGGGHTAIVLVALIIAIFPIIANTSLGLSSVDPNQINLFKMYNASRLQQLMYLRMPFAIPYMLTGIRVSSGLAIIGAIVGEVLLGSGSPDGGGVGYEIQIADHNGDWGLLGAAALAAAMLGIIVFVVLGTLSTLALRKWHESAIQHEN